MPQADLLHEMPVPIEAMPIPLCAFGMLLAMPPQAEE